MNIYYKTYKLILYIKKKIRIISVLITRKKAQMSMNVIVFYFSKQNRTFKERFTEYKLHYILKILLGTQSCKANRWLRLL